MRLDFKKYLFPVFVVLLFGCFPASGQSPHWLETLQNAHTGEGYLKEKIYLHTDRDFYVCGEVIWFKAYLVNELNNKPLSVSKVVYIEVLNNLNQPVLQSKIAMDSGVGNGSLFLPFSLPTGNYSIRAYSNWMKNFSPQNFFKKNIAIVNTSKNLDTPAIQYTAAYKVGFYPEGGNMVNGLKSVIAFKVTDNRNEGAKAEGIIVDQFNDTVAHFNSLQFGMGHFLLTPQSGKEYTAIVSIKNGASIRKKLPQALMKGYVMHVTDTGVNNLIVTVSAGALGNQNSSEIFVLFTSNNELNFAKSQRINNGRAVLLVSKDSLKEGITRITVFDANKQPVGERLVFKQPNSEMLINTKADNESYKPRSKVQVDVVTSGEAGQALAGSLSAAVFKLDDLHQANQGNILSYLWLSSVLKGHIENPAYYFENKNTTSKEALNNLLLTQGWRRFAEEDVAKSKKPSFKYVPEYAGHIITGRITNKLTGQPVAGVPVYLSVPGRRVQLRTCLSDSEGAIHFEMKDFFGKNQIVLQTNTDMAYLYTIEIFSPFSEKISGNVLPSFSMPDNNKKTLQTANVHMAVQQAYHQQQIEQILEPAIDSLPFYYKADKTYYLNNYTRFVTMEEVMREYVAEVYVRKKGTQFSLASINIPGFELRDMQGAQTAFENNPLVLLDGVPVFEINKIIAYDPLKVQKLDVVAQKYHLGTITAEGILSYTTFKGNLEGYTLNPNDLVLDYEGLQKQRVFYSPQYATQSGRLSRLPDFRELLFWEPALKTNKNGIGDFSFYTGDIPGRYMIVVQGISRNGYAGSVSFTINVKK